MDIELNNGSNDHTDYKGRKADPRKHGGIRAASIVCVVEMFQSLVFLSNATNFVDYFLNSMHYSVAESSNMVTNFTGTSFLLSIVGGFVSDSYLTRFSTFIISGALELMGIVMLTYQAQHPRLQPPENRAPSHIQAAILYTGLYATAIGVGGVKATLPAHGADQLDHSNQNLISSFFNWYYFALTIGALTASTVMVWVEDNLGWKLSFTISAIIWSIAICIFVAGFPLYRYKRPAGSALARIIQVFVAVVRNMKTSSVLNMYHNVEAQSDEQSRHSRHKFKSRIGFVGKGSSRIESPHNLVMFLNKALNDSTIDVAHVEETKTFLGLLPIFATTIMVTCGVAQLLTFSVQQGNIMNRKLHNFTIPPQSLSMFPLTIALVFISVFEKLRHMYRHKETMERKIYQPLVRIGAGLALACVSMAVAAIIEAKRRKAFSNGITLSVFWLVLQYILLGVSETLTVGGMLEFFYSEAPDSMKSICTALSWCSNAMGFFVSSILVTITNSVSGRFGPEWLGGHDPNHARFDLFYALLCILNIMNFMFYVYLAKRY